MTIGNTSHPSFTSGISSPDTWINMILELLSYINVHVPASYTTAVPGVIVPGQLYLVGAGATFATPGTIAVFLTPLASSIMGIIPSNGTVVDGWTKVSGGWGKTEFVNGSQVVLTSINPIFVNLPTTFEGHCTLIYNGSSILQVNAGPGRTARGLIGTTLFDGIYHVYQDSTFSNLR